MTEPYPTLEAIWPELRRLASRTMPFVFATVNADGSPQATPIGSVRLDRETARGTFLEKFPTRLRQNLDRDGRFALLAVDTSISTWLGALLRGRFVHLPAARLIGRAGPRRRATAEEALRFQRKVRLTRGTRGYDILWRTMPFARDLVFEGWAPVRLGAMNASLSDAGAGSLEPVLPEKPIEVDAV